MKIEITKVYDVDNHFLSYILANFEKLPNTLSEFEESLDEMLSDYCEDFKYCKNTEDLYKKIKSILE